MFDLPHILRETFVAQVEYHSTIGSTNDQAIQRATFGVDKRPLLILAEEQTAGRGRGKNRWWTGRGGLAFSLLLDAQTVAADDTRSPIVALAAATAIVETVNPLLSGRRVGIHWPNDVIVDGRKLAGVLVEVLPDRQHVVGIGLNSNNTLAAAPPELHATAATIRDLIGREHNQTALLVNLLQSLEHHFAELRQDIKTIAARADSLCLLHSRTLTLNLGRETVTGLCCGIAKDGALKLKTSDGLKAFYTGVVAAIEGAREKL